MKQIAFFDFDGTVTSRDTLLEFIKHQKGNFRFYLGFLLNSPFLIAYKIGVISNQSAKERILSFFFKRTPLEKFQLECDHFSKDILPSLIRPKAITEIQKLKALGFEIVIVSASAENWISNWCSYFQVQLVATRLEKSNGILTGKIDGTNCYGNEKVRRVHELYNLNDYAIIYAYGDTKGDKPLLGLATHSFYKPFR